MRPLVIALGIALLPAVATASSPAICADQELNFVQETTVFREFGPLSGNTMRISYEIAPSIGDWLSYQTVDADARKYIRLGGSGLLALRGKVYHSWGDAPGFQYFGGNSEMPNSGIASSSWFQFILPSSWREDSSSARSIQRGCDS